MLTPCCHAALSIVILIFIVTRIVYYYVMDTSPLALIRETLCIPSGTPPDAVQCLELSRAYLAGGQIQACCVYYDDDVRMQLLHYRRVSGMVRVYQYDVAVMFL